MSPRVFTKRKQKKIELVARPGVDGNVHSVHHRLEGEDELRHVALHVLSLLRNGFHQSREDVREHPEGDGHPQRPEDLERATGVVPVDKSIRSGH